MTSFQIVFVFFLFSYKQITTPLKIKSKETIAETFLSITRQNMAPRGG